MASIFNHLTVIRIRDQQWYHSYSTHSDSNVSMKRRNRSSFGKWNVCLQRATITSANGTKRWIVHRNVIVATCISYKHCIAIPEQSEFVAANNNSNILVVVVLAVACTISCGSRGRTKNVNNHRAICLLCDSTGDKCRWWCDEKKIIRSFDRSIEIDRSIDPQSLKSRKKPGVDAVSLIYCRLWFGHWTRRSEASVSYPLLILLCQIVWRLVPFKKSSLVSSSFRIFFGILLRHLFKFFWLRGELVRNFLFQRVIGARNLQQRIDCYQAVFCG